MIRVALLLHGSNLDDLLAIGALLYLLVLFGLSRLRVRKLKREKLRRRAERARQLHQSTQQQASHSLKDTLTKDETNMKGN